MTYSVYQHWDQLKVCIVGRSYAPEFYSFIANSRVRNVMEKIAYETEEDYQKLINLLESFGVEVLRPLPLSYDYNDYINFDNKIHPPPMTPRDYSIMLGNDFYWKTLNPLDSDFWNSHKGSDWPNSAPKSLEDFNSMPQFIKDECLNFSNITFKEWKPVIDKIQLSADVITLSDKTLNYFNSAMTTRVGKDIYVGTDHYDVSDQIRKMRIEYPEYRWHIVNTGGHSDGVFCPVVPGLIVSLEDIPSYKETFPDWEVIYLPDQSWSQVRPFLDLKRKNQGKWWVPGEELNDDFTDFVESWLGHWVGYVEETVFDVNMLVINEKNVVCNNYNEKVFRAFERYGVTPHVVNFRHRYFWDGGLHCITSDIHREGTMKDYFPERD